MKIVYLNKFMSSVVTELEMNGQYGPHSRQAKPIYIEIKLKIFRLELFLPHSFWEQGLISYFSA